MTDCTILADWRTHQWIRARGSHPQLSPRQPMHRDRLHIQLIPLQDERPVRADIARMERHHECNEQIPPRDRDSVLRRHLGRRPGLRRFESPLQLEHRPRNAALRSRSRHQHARGRPVTDIDPGRGAAGWLPRGRPAGVLRGAQGPGGASRGRVCRPGVSGAGDSRLRSGRVTRRDPRPQGRGAWRIRRRDRAYARSPGTHLGGGSARRADVGLRSGRGVCGLLSLQVLAPGVRLGRHDDQRRPHPEAVHLGRRLQR